MLLRPIAPTEINPMRRPLVRIAGRPAFTLLEVLVVVAILVILASVGAFATLGYLERAKISQAKLQMAKIETACKAYYTNNSFVWPQSLSELIQAPVYLEGGQSAITDPWNQPYQMTIVNDSTGSERVRIISNGGGNGQQPIAWPEK